MEEDQVSSPEEPQAASGASSDSFSRLWSDMMGMLVSSELGEGCHRKATWEKSFNKGLNLLELVVCVL